MPTWTPRAAVLVQLYEAVRCDLLEMVILILEGSHPGSHYPAGEEVLDELADQLRVMLDPAHNLSFEVTQRVMHALRIALTQRPLPPWERRLARQLARAAACDAEPLFGRVVASGLPTG